MWYTRGIRREHLSPVAVQRAAGQTQRMLLVQAPTSDEAGPLSCPCTKGNVMSAFRIHRTCQTHLVKPQDETPVLSYMFIDYDEEMDTEIKIRFIWTGKPSDPVLISGEEDEEPKHGFHVAGDYTLDAGDLLKEFELVCNKWVAIVLPTLRGVVLQ